jgi:Amt family ammonium transporter
MKIFRGAEAAGTRCSADVPARRMHPGARAALRQPGLLLVWMAALFILIPALAYGLDGKVLNADTQQMEAVSDAKFWVDTIWTIITACLVFFMQAGFAMVEGGLTRAKNTGNIMMKNLLDFCMGSLAFWVLGFGLMFGNGNPFFGTTGFMVTPGTAALYDALNWTSVPTLTAWFFQLVFAATAATIVSGAMAERTKFIGYLIYSFIISLIFYPIVGHWIWGGGWLASMGMLDFAGSTVVHSVGGWFALAGAIVIGPRIGKYTKDGRPIGIPGHSLSMAALGTFILWFGWFGFNPGSTMGADVNAISLTATTTNLAAAAGAIGAMAAAWVVLGKPDVAMTLNGALAGLVAITCACAFVEPWAAIMFFGFLPGVLVVFAVLMFDRIGIDDPVGAISVHGICGSFGTILLGLFHSEKGLLYGGGTGFFLTQLIGVASVCVFCLSGGLLLFKAISLTVGLRVTPEEELEGLDVGEHGNSAYPDFLLVNVGSAHTGVAGGPSSGHAAPALARVSAAQPA